MNPERALELFGKLVIAKLRDEQIEHCDGLLASRWKAPALQPLQASLASLNDKQRALVRRCLISCVDVGIHAFLFALAESDSEKGVSVSVAGVNVAEVSDGLHGEPLGKNGWVAKFSKYRNTAE
jgi:hypothetical protein